MELSMKITNRFAHFVLIITILSLLTNCSSKGFKDSNDKSYNDEDETVITVIGRRVISEENQSVEDSDDETIVKVAGKRIIHRNRVGSIGPVLTYDEAYFQRFDPDSLKDILKRVPGVTFEQLVETKDNGKMLINGRYLLEADRANKIDLSSIPSESIKEIQVIRDSDAITNIQAAGFIINVVLKDGSKIPELQPLQKEIIIKPTDPEYWSAERHHQIFRDYGVNPTILSIAKPFSTFAMDVDNGSFKLAETMLDNGELPHQAGIRVEEFVNAMFYNYQTTSEIFSLSAEAMPSPFRPGYHILHLGIQAKEVKEAERLPANIVLIADTSGSMDSDNKIKILKEAFMTLVSELNHDDRIAIVSYSDNARLILKPTPANKKRKIFSAIRDLEAEGSTNAVEGIEKGYDIAEEMFQPGFINRVILTSDGMANVGVTSPEAILKKIRKQRERGIFLTTVGVGFETYNDALLEELADKGNGQYLYFADQSDIQDAFVDRLTGQLQVVARDAKVQIEFNPEAVSHYRLLGYENRNLKTQDFLDATKDGGEIGAGHQVTALYEIKLKNINLNKLATFNISYKKPAGKKVYTLSKEVNKSVVRDEIYQASSDMRLSTAVASLAEKLRQSYWSRLYSYNDIISFIKCLPSSYLKSDQVRTLRSMLKQASYQDDRNDLYEGDTPISSINLNHVPLLK